MWQFDKSHRKWAGNKKKAIIKKEKTDSLKFWIENQIILLNINVNINISFPIQFNSLHSNPFQPLAFIASLLKSFFPPTPSFLRITTTHSTLIPVSEHSTSIPLEQGREGEGKRKWESATFPNTFLLNDCKAGRD